MRLDQIRTLIRLIEDPAIPRLELLGRTQAMVLGAPMQTVPDHPLVPELGAVFDAQSRDLAVLTVAVGVSAYSRLLLSLVAVAQASQSIRRFEA